LTSRRKSPLSYRTKAARRYPFPKARYRVSNWREYDQALQDRGSLTVWITPEAIAAWHPPLTGKRGARQEAGGKRV